MAVLPIDPGIGGNGVGVPVALPKQVLVGSKSDFPTPSSGTITLAVNTEYFLTADVDVGTDRFILGDNSNIRAQSSGLATLTYTGTGDMLTGVGVSSKVSQIRIDCPNGKLLNIDGGGTGIFQMLNMTIGIVDDLGTIKDLAGTQLFSILFASITTNGLLFTGSHKAFLASNILVTINGGTLLNLGIATFDAFSFTTSFPTVAVGATMVSGAASSANINTGGFGTVENVIMEGAGTALTGITIDDAQWQFSLNNTIADTRPDALLSFNTPTTTTAAVNTPTLIAGTWTLETSSQFTTTAAGRATYNGVKNAQLPVSIGSTIEAVSGTNKDITLYLALNGVVISNSRSTNRVSSNDPKNTSIMWQLTLTPGDFIEVFIENNTDGIGLTINKASIRVN